MHTDRHHHHNPHYHSFCSHCCHPASACCCSAPQCRKEPKGLVVTPKTSAVGKGTIEIHRMATSILSMQPEAEESAGAETGATLNVLRMKSMNAEALSKQRTGIGTAFIGGGCCVHLSVEYMPESPTAPADGVVLAAVIDSESTVLVWGKYLDAKSNYEIKENIITTNPGAKLVVYAVNFIVRVRWCEIFSC